MSDYSDFAAQERLLSRQQKAFGEAEILRHYCFRQDNGRVLQMEQARRYVAHWEQMEEQNLGLLFWGKPGNGKTFAAGCIANALMEQVNGFFFTVKMTTFGTILTRLPGMSAQEKERYLDDFKTCDLLILDDFGMERQTDYAREQIFNIIDGRYLSRKPLIVTTNMSLQELKNPKDLAQQRIFDRILEMCVPVCFDGDSLRQEKARDNLRLYKQLTAGVSV